MALGPQQRDQLLGLMIIRGRNPKIVEVCGAQEEKGIEVHVLRLKIFPEMTEAMALQNLPELVVNDCITDPKTPGIIQAARAIVGVQLGVCAWIRWWKMTKVCRWTIERQALSPQMEVLLGLIEVRVGVRWSTDRHSCNRRKQNIRRGATAGAGGSIEMRIEAASRDLSWIQRPERRLQ